jgi:hypothetical protein
MMATSVSARVVDKSELEDTQGKKRWYIIVLALIVIGGAVVGGVISRGA